MTNKIKVILLSNNNCLLKFMNRLKANSIHDKKKKK